MSWTKKVLRINLTKGTCKSEPLNMEWAEQFLGQRGLATKYLTEEVPPKTDPLSPENTMYLITGPLTGTMASTAGRYSVVTKSPLTGVIACSNSGGFFGNEMKCAGWDMVILEGKAKSPVYIHIDDDDAQILPADEIWGKSVWEADEWLHAKHQDPQLRVAAVGVSAEKGVLYAGIINDLHRAAGRSGVGTVMASKNVKAVTIRGSKGVSVDDPKAFFEATTAAKKILAENPVTGEGLPALGTQVLMNVINETGAMPTHNWKHSVFEGASKISGEAMLEARDTDGKPNLTRNAGCFACTISCGRISTINPEHFSVQNKDDLHKSYAGNSGGLEYEAAWALGSDTGIDDLDALTYAQFVCNEQGIDPISLGSTIAAAMEMFEEGFITTKDTDGIDLKFGNAEALVKCTELVGKGEGFGAELGQGSAKFCAKHGHPELSMTVRGQEFPAYDPRGIQGMGLGYATSNRGACHLRGYTVASEVLGIPIKTDPLETEGKAGLQIAFQNATAAFDSAGICIFTSFAWSLEDVAPQLNAACEGEWTVERLGEIGERIWNLERLYNEAAGFGGASDTLPPRLLKEGATSGPAEGKVSGLATMLPEYYAERGWAKDGSVTKETKARLGL
ncbi:MAG: aldehyde ferredoxin oxidoreductase [Cycloclasticus sp. symbiont of Poecilosclerida sp. M]|nr:MAG: aldehyde ferredoxin oxidoreductase [Cycloclasticus sp. symbiont of Poecilosclerida sp. M]